MASLKSPVESRPHLTCGINEILSHHLMSKFKYSAARARKHRRWIRLKVLPPNDGNAQAQLVRNVVDGNYAATRGPKRGYVKALETRLATLEQRLLDQQQQQHQPNWLPQMDTIDLLDGATLGTFFDMGASDSVNGSLLPPSSAESIIPQKLDFSATVPLSDLLRSELDQLYFERTHPFLPFLNQHRYLSQSRQRAKSESQMCLQYAMWTMASASSAQLHHVRDSLYECTRQMLDSLEAKDSNTVFTDIEHVQARILLLVYDFLKTSHQRGWLSAGRCFRLCQLMALHSIDGLENVAKLKCATQPEDWIETEIKRRTFWVAYSLDRFICTRHDRPLTFVHPFTPLPLTLSVDFFNTHRWLDESVDAQIEDILEVLKDLTSVNNLAQDYLA
ncbi:MAG: hypothetical protein Q9213_003871 [Squamulea squamosa]